MSHDEKDCVNCGDRRTSEASHMVCRHCSLVAERTRTYGRCSNDAEHDWMPYVPRSAEAIDMSEFSGDCTCGTAADHEGKDCPVHDMPQIGQPANRVCSNCGEAGHWYSACARVKRERRSAEATPVAEFPGPGDRERAQAWLDEQGLVDGNHEALVALITEIRLDTVKRCHERVAESLRLASNSCVTPEWLRREVKGPR